MLYSFDSHAKLLASIQESTDENLMTAVRDECTEALNELYRRHHLTLRAVIGRVLHNDPAMGVIRHADAGYDIAIATAEEHSLRI
mgnify:CR=1 FL=1